MVDVEEGAVLCSMPHCEEPAGSACCTGSTPHYVCDACFCGYASAQFESVLGAFEQERTKEGGTSAPGELPCYLFLTDECDCASIPVTTLVRVLSMDRSALEAYENAKRRLVGDSDEEEETEDNEVQESRLKQLRKAVDNALSRGGYVECPSCGNHGQKNEACMHMTCSCSTRYCYCCGRERGAGLDKCTSDGTGCDWPSAFLENHRGWTALGINGESAGLGALHEYHRRRMAYFLRQVKADHPASTWKKLKRKYPNILNDKPTDGRSIQWDEIETATPPLFGGTIESQLQWKNATELAGDQQPQEQAGQTQQRDVAPFRCSVRQFPFIALWMIGFILAVVLLTRRALAGGESNPKPTNLLIAALVGTGLPMLVMLIVDCFAARPDPFSCCIHDVQCFRWRQHQELPYLAAGGRWSHRRVAYWYIFFGGITLAIVFLINNDIPAVHATGAVLISFIAFYYWFLKVVVNNNDLALLLQPTRTQFKCFMVLMGIYVACLSVGIGLMTAYDNESHHRVGQVLVVTGFAGSFAELTPRFCCSAQVFTATPSILARIFSYIVCSSLAVGTLLLELSDSYIPNTVGVAFLCAAGLALCCLCASSRAR